MTQIAAALSLAAIGVGARELRAQCPDGSPPPCRAQTAAATPRRVNPPLDDRTWIVVPFDNLAKNAEADWLRSASVNLLYLDMSRWRDIRVIDDERVSDLIRETPEANDATNLSLNAGLAVAKRAGAGRLVMGDVLKLGSRTTVTAKIFNVKSGQRVRSVREETTVADSVMPLFSRLAKKILNVAPPQGANLGGLGTTRMDAYQEYMSGVEALSRYDLKTAHQHFDEALRLDSSFALAHYKQSIVIGWEDSSDPSRRRRAEAANRLSAGLPARERALIAGQLQQSTGDWTKACETYGGLVKADSADVEAWYNLGECLYHDPTIEAVGGDSTRLRFRADLQRSIRAFERTLQLDPTYHLAYQHIIDGLTSDRHPNVCYQAAPTARCVFYGAFLIRPADTLVVTPVPLADTAKLPLQAEQYIETRSRRRNLDLAQTYAEAWVQASPGEPQGHRALARVMVLQGRVGEAETELAQIKARGTLTDERRVLLERMEIAYKLGRGTEAIRLYDSVRTGNITLPGTAFTAGNAISGYAPAFGRLTEFDSLLAVNLRAAGVPDGVQRYMRLAVRGAFTGIAADSLVAAESMVFDLWKARGTVFATRGIAPSLMFSLRAPRTAWSAIDTTIRDLKLRPAIALAGGDTAKLRLAAQALDSLSAMMAAAGASDSGFAVIAADAYLVLRDSVAALRALRFMLDNAVATTSYFVATTSYFPQGSSQFAPVYFAPRAMLLRADLAAAAGQRDEARTWYKRFIDVWSTAVPELQPLVDRARKSLAALGGSA